MDSVSDPIDVIFSQHDVVQPDIVVVTDRAQISKRGIEGNPLLVVEVLSPSTAKTDRTVKLTRYAEVGVGHYWIVDPDARTLECYRAEGGRYAEIGRATAPVTMDHPDFPGLVIDVGALWDADA